MTNLRLLLMKPIGVISEMLSWKLRLFMPGEGGPAILARPIERHPIAQRADPA